MVTCKDSRWDRIVAIKFVAAKDNELQRDAKREAQIMELLHQDADLDAVHICKLLQHEFLPAHGGLCG